MKKAILFTFLILLISFLILEVGSRIAYSLYTGSASYLIYGYGGIFDNFSGVKKKIDNSRPIFRIACFGESTTEGSAINNYPRFLEGYLQKRFPDIQVIVYNYGIGGATPTEVAYMLRSSVDMDLIPNFSPNIFVWGKKERMSTLLCSERKANIPDLIFVYCHANATWTETLRLKGILPEEEYKTMRKITPNVNLRGRPAIVRAVFVLNHCLKSKSFFYYSLCRMFFWLQHDRYLYPVKEINKGMDVVQSTVQRIQKDISKHQKHVKTANFQESLTMAVYTAKRFHKPIILGAIPICGKNLTDSSSREIDETSRAIHKIYENVIKETCYKENIPMFDGVKLFRDTPDSDKFFNDFVHLNDQGNHFLAGKIGEFIISGGYIKNNIRKGL